MDTPEFLFDGPETAPVTVVLAHGAGAPMDHPFMTAMAERLAGHGLRVARFEFAYMARRRAEGSGRRPPDRAPVLMACWRTVIDALRPQAKTLVIGGKSMGGRIASMVADDAGAAGVVCLGYPFHPPGKPENTRTAHLEDMRTPILILQGERDVFGTPADVAGYHLAKSVSLHWLADGDHGLKPRKASGRTEAGNLDEAAAAIAAFVQKL